MRRLILARHGESEYSASGRVNGDPGVTVRLTERGREEARALGAAIAGDAVDVCVVTALPRTRETAELALAGRGVPLEVEPRLNDPRAGSFEGRHLDEYRVWAWSKGSAEEAPGGGESRLGIVQRYVEGLRALLDRPEGCVLAVLHALPIAYVLAALDGRPPAARVDLPVAHAQPHRLEREQLAGAVDVLAEWSAAPSW